MSRLLVRILQDGKARIADKAHWVQGTFAQDDGGRSVDPDDVVACSFCALGVLRSLGFASTSAAECLLDEVADALFDLEPIRAARKDELEDVQEDSIVLVNDFIGFEAVHAVYDEAIRRAEAA